MTRASSGTATPSSNACPKAPSCWASPSHYKRWCLRRQCALAHRLSTILQRSILRYADRRGNPTFLGDARSLGLTDGERLAIVTWIAANPQAGDVIEGTGGARKVRFAGKGKGKSGGYRVITFFSGADIPVFLLNIFAKNEKTDLAPKERRVLKSVLANIVRTYGTRMESR
jgi:hypothetical protein